MAEKITIAKRFEAIISTYRDVMSEKDIQFLKERAEQASKKNANRKPTKAQEENAIIKQNILDSMEEGKRYTVTEIQKLVDIAEFNKANALVRQLKLDSLVIRETDKKGRALFVKA